jgi:EAL domain-containing protein (putative c-di-GMP-specific phosphodiesterase class I)
MSATDSMQPQLAALHLRRVRLMLRLGAWIMIALGICWAVFFGYRGAWGFVAMDVVMVILGACVLLLNRHNHTRRAFYLLLASMFMLVCGISLVFDIPSQSAPRSTHHFLILLGVSALLFLQEERGFLRHWAAGACFLAFAVLASSNVALTTAYALPDSIRTGGTWVNTLAAIAGVYAMVHIMISDVVGISSLELDLRKGIAREEFFLVYQPQVTSRGDVIGAEALLRWNHPARGVVSPVEFIPIAEQTGLIVPLGLQALAAACKALVVWAEQADLANLTLSVNVSAQQFRRPDFVEQVHNIIRTTRVSPQRLKLELTESLLIDNFDDIALKMTQLRLLGVGFSLDDFGTGYSSLNYLKRLPLDQLKIDQSFVRDVLTDGQGAAIATTVIQLGKSMGFAVIAEGVETQGQRDFLIDKDCHVFQGYFFSKPLPLERFVAFTRESRLGSVFSGV